MLGGTLRPGIAVTNLGQAPQTRNLNNHLNSSHQARYHFCGCPRHGRWKPTRRPFFPFSQSPWSSTLLTLDTGVKVNHDDFIRVGRCEHDACMLFHIIHVELVLDHSICMHGLHQSINPVVHLPLFKRKSYLSSLSLAACG